MYLDETGLLREENTTTTTSFSKEFTSQEYNLFIENLNNEQDMLDEQRQYEVSLFLKYKIDQRYFIITLLPYRMMIYMEITLEITLTF
jgi:hypothetical protein